MICNRRRIEDKERALSCVLCVGHITSSRVQENARLSVCTYTKYDLVKSVWVDKSSATTETTTHTHAHIMRPMINDKKYAPLRNGK